MVGQKRNKEIIDQWVSKGTFPRFLIIYGRTGSGKKELVKYIQRKFNCRFIYNTVGVDDVRDTIKDAYKAVDKVFYVFADCDNMSNAAKGALLKITEEPPENAYFILTVSRMANLPDTLRSRSSTIDMQPYSKQELREVSGDDMIIKLATNPGELIELQNMDVRDLVNTCKNFADLLKERGNGTKIFKIIYELKYKPEDKGVSPVLFLNTLCMIYKEDAMETNDLRSVKAFMECSKALGMLSRYSVKKISVMDVWALTMQDIWMEE